MEKLNNTGNKPLYTGKYFIVPIGDNPIEEMEKLEHHLKDDLNLSVSHSHDKDNATDEHAENDALVYDKLGVALINAKDEKIQTLSSESHGRNFIIQPESFIYLPDNEEVYPFANIPSTWGIKHTEVIHSKYTGKDIKIAVLDTGLDLEHPDFQNRNIISQSFVPNQQVHDEHGHGTHCIGTACGDSDLHNKRYGVAKNSLIHVGKVLSNQGIGEESWILNAIEWAISKGCKVISMSLGLSVRPGEGYIFAYEAAAKSALSQGCILVAAAGNDSDRENKHFVPVSSPANCPSILAVGALDENLNVANFSNRSINPTGQIDIVAPGGGVYSSWIMPDRYKTISGTSMATPHVAGILALLWEKYPNAKSEHIITEMRNLARRLPHLSVDVGDGLTIAPQEGFFR